MAQPVILSVSRGREMCRICFWNPQPRSFGCIPCTQPYCFMYACMHFQVGYEREFVVPRLLERKRVDDLAESMKDG